MAPGSWRLVINEPTIRRRFQVLCNSCRRSHVKADGKLTNLIQFSVSGFNTEKRDDYQLAAGGRPRIYYAEPGPLFDRALRRLLRIINFDARRSARYADDAELPCKYPGDRGAPDPGT